MCHKLSNIIIEWCCTFYFLNDYTKIKATYGMEVFLELFWKIIGFFVIGLFINKKIEFFLSLWCFSTLRLFIGGRHCSSSLFCFFTMIFIGLTSANIFSRFVIPPKYGIFLFGLAITLVIRYAPFSSKLIYKNKLIKKTSATIILIIYLLFFLLIEEQSIKNVFLCSPLMEIATILHIKDK